jgi:hypothetical protein
MHLGHGRSPRNRVHVGYEHEEEDRKWHHQSAGDDDDQEDSEVDLVEQFYDQQDDPQLYSYPHRLVR